MRGRSWGWTALMAGLVGGVGPAGAQTPPTGDGPPPDSVVEIEGLAVSVESRLAGSAATRAVTVLDRAALEALPATTVTEALTWATGVDLQPRSAAQADVAVRGGTTEQVLVLVDGVPMSDAQTGHFDLDLAVPLESVERIEVLRGAASAVYGADAVGGVIQVVTRRPGSAPRGRASLEGGTFDRFAAAVSGEGGMGDWAASAALRLDRSDGHRSGTDHDQRWLHLGLDGPVGGGRARVQLGVAARDFGADGFYAPFPSYEETRTRTLSAAWRRSVGGAVVDVTLHGREHDDDFVLRRGDPAFYRNVHTSRQTGIDVALRSESEGPWAWSVGATGGRDDLESTNLGDRSADRGAAFAEVGWAGAAAGVRAGLRLDAREDFAPAWAPSLSGAWSPASTVRLRGAVARSFRAPTWTDRYYEDPANRGDPNLAVETAWSGEVGVDWRPLGPARVGLTTFVREARDLIDYARPADGPDDAVWQTRNVASATFRGVELDVHGVAVGPVALDGAVELLDVSSDEAGAFVSKYALRPLTHTVQMGARIPLLGRATVGFRVANRRREGEDDRTTVALRLDARFGATRLWTDVTNLGDAAWLDVSGLPAPGRAVRTGISVAF